jgi:hypothetical protein
MSEPKTIPVENMFECPFKYERDFSYSEYTHGTDTLCTLRSGDDSECCQEGCPLKGAEQIVVKWQVNTRA